MIKIQKKALQHTSDILKTFDTYPIYSAISKALENAKVPAEDKRAILNTLQEESSKLNKISTEAKTWIDTIIEYLK